MRWLQPESPPKVSGQPARSRDADTDARYTYDAVGNLHSTSYRNAVAATYTFNPRNWLRCLTSVLGAVVVASFDYDGALAAPGQPWLAETCLSPTGQRRAIMETVGTATRTVAYGYDLLSRLTKEDIQSATASPTALVAYDGTGTGQGYDRVGNRRSRQVTGTLPGVSAYTGHTFSDRDLLNPNPQTGYTYDLNGNTTKDPGGTLYAYDAENRLVKVTKPDGTTITLAYDADGNRVRKVVDAPGTANDTTTLYLVDDRNPTVYAQVVEERDVAGATTVTYTYGLDLVSQRRGTKVSYYGYDGLGSVRYLTDETGAVTDTYTYDAFGILIGQQVLNGGVLEPVTPLNQHLSTLNSYCYTGEQRDGDLDLYYLRARYYEPQLGRFWTMDTYEGSQSDPLSLHKYLYAHADPINNTDPSGNETLIGISLAGTMIQGVHGKYDAGVSTVGNSIKNTIIGLYSGMSIGQIVALNFLDNAGGVIAGKLIGKLAQLRRLPGIVKGVGRAVQGGRWPQGSHGNAGFVPAQVAQRLAGRQFKNFDEFRGAFWREVAGEANLSKAFSPSNVARMREGNAPFAHPTQWVGGKKSYELHHARPIQHGGEVYDMDNIVVVTPRYHQDVLEPAYHY